MTLLSKLFTKFPKLQQKVQKIPHADEYVNPEGLVIPQNLAAFFNQVASELYKFVGQPNGQSEISAVINFDQQQRVSTFQNLLVDNKPIIPPFQAVEKVNDMMHAKLQNAPLNYKVRQLQITIKSGNVNTKADYFS